MPKIKLLLFDIFNTLLHPRLPVHEQYYLVATSPPHSLPLPPREIALPLLERGFKDALKGEMRKWPIYGRGRRMEEGGSVKGGVAVRGGVEVRIRNPGEWWSGVIRETFRDLQTQAEEQEAEEGKEEERGNSNGKAKAKAKKNFEAQITDLIPTLLARFETKAAYALFPDVLPTLTALRARGVKMGVISNSDGAVVRALRDLGVGEFMNLEIEGDEDRNKRAALTTLPTGSPTLSYHEGVEKPHRGIFQAALRRHGMEGREGEVLVVGDRVEEDFWGGRRAGLGGVWVDREGVGEGSLAGLRGGEGGGGGEGMWGSATMVEERDEVVRGRIGSLVEVLGMLD